MAFANEWLQTNTPNFRIPIATLGVAFLFAGIERVNTKAGIGLAWMMLILAMTTPINGKAPAQTVLAAMQQPKPSKKTPTKR